MTAFQPMITGTRHVVAAGHYLATEAAMEILNAGGNAIDAGVAANLVLGVVQSEMVNIAGVAPIMIYSAEHDEMVTLAGLGGWPAAARIDYFVDQHGGTIPLGVHRTVIPAAPDAWIEALIRYGSLPFEDVLRPAIALAREGFPMHHVMRDYIAANEAHYRRWPENARIYLPNGTVPAIGASFVQSDLAATMQYMACLLYTSPSPRDPL